APYGLVWSNALAGVHLLTAVASDNLGSTTVSAPVSIVFNARPSVTITSPSSGSNLDAGGNVTITAVASDSDGNVTQVQFFEGANLIGTGSTAASIAPKADYQFQDSLGSSTGTVPS